MSKTHQYGFSVKRVGNPGTGTVPQSAYSHAHVFRGEFISVTLHSHLILQHFRRNEELLRLHARTHPSYFIARSVSLLVTHIPSASAASALNRNSSG